jgi:hypothetical protein
MKTFARILAPLTLLEWGGILTYFYFSGRIAAFLHPMFRPLVLVTGILLLITTTSIPKNTDWATIMKTAIRMTD